MLGIERNSDEAFLNRLYNMVDDPSTDSIASWSQTGKSFIVWNPAEFSRIVVVLFGSNSGFLPGVLCSIGYGFRMVGNDIRRQEYAHDYFVRGKPELMKNIPRKGFFITKEDLMEAYDLLIKEKEELLGVLRKQEMQIKELKYHLQHIGICKL